MRLTCHKCKHRWEDEVSSDQQVVMCPKCFEIVPMVLATRESAPSPPPSPDDEVAKTKITPPPTGARPAKPPTPRPSTPVPGEDVHEEKTIRTPTTPSPAGESKQLAETTPVARPGIPSPPTDMPTTPSPAFDKTRPTPGPPAEEPGDLQQLIGRSIDGYRVEKLLGKGGMGAVFLAHQISLDRKVALKVLPTRFAQDPELLARFTREALSAAQLNHHNIVQVYDVGSMDHINYICMEYVRGKNLGDMIREEGRLQLDDAAAYVLQAARGLRYAHQCGIIHRDIKPDNLMFNEHGVVKIADMGLAKWRKQAEASLSRTDDEALTQQQIKQDLTMSKVALGTPAYMAPEQAVDAGAVDERADQYSLGCTLYYMCAGKAPYSGTTAFELLSKHMKEPLTPLDAHVQGVPPAFSAILNRMLEKNPEDRYPDMEAVIKDLEAYLGVAAEEGAYAPREYDLAMLEQQQKAYYSVPSTKKRSVAQRGFFALMGLFFLLALMGGDFGLAGGALGLLVLTPVAGFILNGILTKEYLFRRVRSVFFGMPMRSWLTFIAGSLFGIAVLYFLGWLYYWLGFMFVAVGVTAGYQMLVLKPLRAERAGALKVTHEMLKRLRVRGVSEEALYDFVCRFSGDHWEEFFEELFGYEEMIIARGKWAAAERVKPRKRFAIWREPLARFLESIEQARKVAHEKRQLVKAEARRLQAKGVSEKIAEREAELEATRIFETGLIKKRPVEKAAAEKPVAKKTRRRRRIHQYPSLTDAGIRIVCFAGGIAVTVVALALVLPQRGITALSALTPILHFVPAAYHTQWGWGGTELAVGAGLALFLMSFASRPILRILVLMGVVLLLLRSPILNLVSQPQLTEQRIFYGGIGLIIFGFGYSFFAAVRGEKF